ncbi:ubinuclein-1-like isoform X3 [Telopea speciosissima]|uniref:ubinuclein-1-like isoform X3 n=1 Tax=Telopea speciosissima TaxID=54955 RepID=UPI001CC72E51|nr:ubinuclein-1-like isoform X3 [Telopea speciosissima]
MEEEKVGSGSCSSRVVSSSSFPAATTATTSAAPSSSVASTSKDGRGFFVELNPGDTTIVSWKKLLKDANKANRSPAAPPDAPSGAHPALESRIAPAQPVEDDVKDAPPSNRFSAVIEKIERLYVGKQSSDEEELDNVPDDDQYDTEDSFIDDAELDEYFQVDKSPMKHNGFFVNRGQLERINHPVVSPDLQPKKRRRKDLIKAHGEKDGEQVANKHAKMGNMRMKAAARTAPLVGSKSSSPQILPAISEHYQDGKGQNQLNTAVGTSKKKSADSSNDKFESSSAKILNRDSSVFPVEVNESEKQKVGIVQSNELNNKLKVESESADTTYQAYWDKSASTQFEPQPKKPLNGMDELEASTKVRHRDKNGGSELPDLNSSGSKYLTQTATQSMHVKEGSSVRPKGTMLERAIRELEKMVAESRPPVVEVQDADTSSQAVKRRLPQEVKQKLAKVARLAQSSQGRISEELVNRLTSILGHLVQRKTIKRNLKEMVELGLSAKQEKDGRFQQIKKEVIEMVKMRVPSLKPKTSEQRDGATDDFQEVHGSEDKGVKGKYNMDDAMEDKICDLYDLFVEGMDEDKGPQVRKLYVELAELWPNGCMDNHGVKNAICRSKERKRALYNRHKVQGKIKKKKLSVPKTEEIIRGEASSVAQPRIVQERLGSDSSGHGLMSPNRMISSMATSGQHLATSVRMPTSSTNGLSMDRPKQEKVKGTTFMDDMRRADGALVKKKIKRKPESELGEVHLHPEKFSQVRKEKHKYPKIGANQPHKSTLQTASIPSCDQPS